MSTAYYESKGVSRREASMQIKEIMTTGVEVVRPDETLEAAARKMKSIDVGPLPVCDGDRLVGNDHGSRHHREGHRRGTRSEDHPGQGSDDAGRRLRLRRPGHRAGRFPHEGAADPASGGA